MSELAPAQPVDGRVLDAGLHLLDRQVIDSDGVPICVVDDIELAGAEVGKAIARGTPAPTIVALLSGPVLATRMFGGRPPASRLHRIGWENVTRITTAIRLGVRGDTLDVTWVERWVRDRVIGRIPGAGHDPE